MILLDLSLPIKNCTNEPDPPNIEYLDHWAGADELLGFANRMIAESGSDIPELDRNIFPGGLGLANEKMRIDPHSGTHLDAPWHFGPSSGEKKALTIDEIPLEWCFSDGVVLDLRHKKAGELINEDDIKRAESLTGYSIKPLDIVLVMTGADKYFNKENYCYAHPGMGSEATRYIVEKGVKIIGIDAWGFDRPAANMLEDYLKTGDNSRIFPAHFAGREMEYCHIEKLANLDRIPVSSGFKVACFPVKIEKASAGWCRAVVML